MKLFTCTHCGNRVFFENLSCEVCHATLGYVPAEQTMVAFATDDDGHWRRLGPDGPAYRPCSNYANEHVCNWMVPADSPHQLCASCRTTHTIPALGKPQNRAYWHALEQEKRRLFYTLIELGLPTPNKLDDPVNGLSFEFLEETSPKARVLTGHDEGVITLNIAEADDAQRERIRLSMHEPYRTLLGHFRHEIGHYYWDRLIRNTPWIDECRALFGDETIDYADALKRHYAAPRADWPQHFISVYASSHPWEDWAETWAHYLHMADTADTAMSFGVDATNVELASDLFTPDDLWLPGHPGAARFLDFLNGWVLLTNVLNELSRSMGQPDYYPFVLPRVAVGKLQFIHCVITEQRDGPASTGAAPAAEPAPAQSQTQSQEQNAAQS